MGIRFCPRTQLGLTDLPTQWVPLDLHQG